MKFGKELKSQMVPEWQEAYMDYEFLKNLLKDILHHKKDTTPAPNSDHPSGLTRTLSHYRAFSGLTSVQRSLSMRSTTSSHHEDIENHPIVVNNVKGLDGEDGYVTTYRGAGEDDGEQELIFFNRLDIEFNKVNKFYRAKVEEVMKQADELDKQMNALIAFRIKVDNPQHAWFETAVDIDKFASTTSLSTSNSSSGRGPSKRILPEQMDKIEEDRSLRGLRSDDSDDLSSRDHRISDEIRHSSGRVVPEVTMSKSSRSSTDSDSVSGRPPSLEILKRVTVNKAADTPLSTIKNVLNVPVDTNLKFTKENLSKVEDQLKKAFAEFYHKLRHLKSYSFLNILAFSKIMKKHDKITSRNASKSYLKMVDNSYIGSSDEGSDLKKYICLRFLAGCTVALLFALVMSVRTRKIVEKDGHGQYMETMFPLYSFFGFIVLHMLFYAGNIYFWKKYKINYQFIFGFKAGTELGYREVLLLSFGLSVLALASIHANLDMDIDPKTNDYQQFTELIPLILVILIFLIMICPFNIIYRSSRYFFLTCSIHTFFSLLYKCVRRFFEEKDAIQGWNSLKYFAIVVSFATRTAYGKNNSNECLRSRALVGIQSICVQRVSSKMHCCHLFNCLVCAEMHLTFPLIITKFTKPRKTSEGLGN
uniref:SPX domain-containing protein n=1 Tax=Daucus carota subsp. sativus TaxID=79200 RepID=A0A175YNV1_DAUCS